MYTLEQLQDKTFKELKEIGWELNVLPAGDRRCRQNWVDAIAGVLPPLLELLETSPGVEDIQRRNYAEPSGISTEQSRADEIAIGAGVHRQCLNTTQPDGISSGLEAETLGSQKCDRVLATARNGQAVERWLLPHESNELNELIETPIATFNDEQPPNRGEDRGRIESAIAQLPKNSMSVVRSKSSTAHQLLELLRSRAYVLEPIKLQHQEPINESPGVTFSPKSLALYSPPQLEQISYKADAGGQLSLLDFDIESADEPPDPDDFESIEAFWDAMTAWDAEHSELLEISIESFSEWTPCPLEWHEPQEMVESSSTLEIPPVSVESSSTCEFLIPVFGVASDRTIDNDEPPTTGVCARRPSPKPPSFPPTIVVAGDRSSIEKFARCAILLSGRSPPGGDAVPFT